MSKVSTLTESIDAWGIPQFEASVENHSQIDSVRVGSENAIKEDVWIRHGNKSSKSSSEVNSPVPVLLNGQTTCSKLSQKTQRSSQEIQTKLIESKMSFGGSLQVKNKSQLQHLPEVDEKLFSSWLLKPDASKIDQLGDKPIRTFFGSETWLFRLKFKNQSEYRGLGRVVVTEYATRIVLLVVKHRSEIDYQNIKDTQTIPEELDLWGLPIEEASYQDMPGSRKRRSRIRPIERIAKRVYDRKKKPGIKPLVDPKKSSIPGI